MPRWLLPESISDILPSEARRIEMLRRRLLDLYRTYGYELVMPPMIEYIESLLTGSGHDLDLKTFKLIDQLSGRTMGVRADITPQVARIDSHLLDRSGITRLCYAASVLHTRASGPLSTREPLQIGAELYGHPGLEADLEVIELLLQSLQLAGVSRVRIDLG
ncbi:MAG: ATP phosphoribosyltransferase regulatory subunit, partial [Burkholderiales bacterium]